MYVRTYSMYVCMYLAVWELQHEVHIPLRRNEDVVECVDEHRVHRSLHVYMYTLQHIYIYMHLYSEHYNI